MLAYMQAFEVPVTFLEALVGNRLDSKLVALS